MSDKRISITDQLSIAEADLQESFIHAAGPGGQNVNKVETGVQLRYNPRVSADLPTMVIKRAEDLAGSRLTKSGDIVIQATRFRRQEQNREDARNRLVELLREAAKPPPPERKPTKPSRSARAKRMDSKTKRGAIKSMRKAPKFD